MIKIYSKVGFTRAINELENGCNAYYQVYRGVEYGTSNPIYVNIRMYSNKYSISARTQEYAIGFCDILFKEYLTLKELKEVIKQYIWTKK